MTIYPRHFSYKHPIFRAAKNAKGSEWKKSVYYLWWEYLRRHEGYRATCANHGRGKHAKLYEDFGDVHATDDFKTWWTKDDRGARLFAEPPLPTSVTALTRDDLDHIKENWNDESLLVVAIPINLPKKAINERLKKIISRQNKRRRGQRLNKESKALYPVAKQFTTQSLQVALKVYDMRQQHPEMTDWEIAQKLRFTTTLDQNEIGTRGKQNVTAVVKKASMSVAVSRKLKKAKEIIENVGNGVFPV